MASGYKDYWRFMPAIKGINDPDKIAIQLYEAKSIGAGANAIMVQYTVLPGYEFFPTGAVLSCDHPGLQQVVIKLISTTGILVKWDTLYQPNILGQGLFSFPAGSWAGFQVYNIATRLVTFHAGLIGFITSV